MAENDQNTAGLILFGENHWSFRTKGPSNASPIRTPPTHTHIYNEFTISTGSEHARNSPRWRKPRIGLPDRQSSPDEDYQALLSCPKGELLSLRDKPLCHAPYRVNGCLTLREASFCEYSLGPIQD
ncbi:hypothetical protein RRG08_031462 [Elysia crispata]|uniref:Uncharacterized protein n=1 Tax=Elysia crispata TaxID=231223 RepID=A0AAE0ZNJ0_9GAST|nr:hypothetical protein RRG08_031462 [Elysia crispata]